MPAQVTVLLDFQAAWRGVVERSLAISLTISTSAPYDVALLVLAIPSAPNGGWSMQDAGNFPGCTILAIWCGGIQLGAGAD